MYSQLSKVLVPCFTPFHPSERGHSTAGVPRSKTSTSSMASTVSGSSDSAMLTIRLSALNGGRAEALAALCGVFTSRSYDAHLEDAHVHSFIACILTVLC